MDSVLKPLQPPDHPAENGPLVPASPKFSCSNQHQKKRKRMRSELSRLQSYNRPGFKLVPCDVGSGTGRRKRRRFNRVKLEECIPDRKRKVRDVQRNENVNGNYRNEKTTQGRIKKRRIKREKTQRNENGKETAKPKHFKEPFVFRITNEIFADIDADIVKKSSCDASFSVHWEEAPLEFLSRSLHFTISVLNDFIDRFCLNQYKAIFHCKQNWLKTSQTTPGWEQSSSQFIHLDFIGQGYFPFGKVSSRFVSFLDENFSSNVSALSKYCYSTTIIDGYVVEDAKSEYIADWGGRNVRELSDIFQQELPRKAHEILNSTTCTCLHRRHAPRLSLAVKCFGITVAAVTFVPVSAKFKQEDQEKIQQSVVILQIVGVAVKNQFQNLGFEELITCCLRHLGHRFSKDLGHEVGIIARIPHSSGKWLSERNTGFTAPAGHDDIDPKWKKIIDVSYALLHMFHRHKLDGQTAMWTSSLDPPSAVPSIEKALNDVLYKISCPGGNTIETRRAVIPEFVSLPRDALEWLRREKFAR